MLLWSKSLITPITDIARGVKPWVTMNAGAISRVASLLRGPLLYSKELFADQHNGIQRMGDLTFTWIVTPVLYHSNDLPEPASSPCHPDPSFVQVA